jgi:GT2 family glycosyltransferase
MGMSSRLASEVGKGLEIVLTQDRSQSAAKLASREHSVSVVVCAYTVQRLGLLRAAVASIDRQTFPALETLVVIDHQPGLLRLANETLGRARMLENAGEPGLSAARNTGVRSARGDIVAFLDDDAIAEDTWLEALTHAYEDPRVVGAGGVVRPLWEHGKGPRWLPSEFYWTVGCSYRGLPEECAPVRNPIGAGMSFRRDVLERLEGFTCGIGRIGQTPLGCEETELSIRARRTFPGAIVLHLPSAGVAHHVPAERTSWGYFRARCWSEGLSKALVAREVGSEDALASEWTYTLKTLPTGALRGLVDAFRGDITGVVRSAAILSGLLITLAGYLRGRLAPAR